MKNIFYGLIFASIVLTGCTSKGEEAVINNKDTSTIEKKVTKAAEITKIQEPVLSEEESVIAQLNWNETRKIVSNGITYRIERIEMSKDRQDFTGRQYEEVISKIDFRLPLEDRVITIIKKSII